MAGFSTQLAQDIANCFFKNTAKTGPGTLYLALFTGNPTDDTATAISKEVSGGWYTRQIIAFGAPSALDPVTISNTGQIIFNAVTTSATNVTYWGIFDASTAGNLMCSDAFATTKILNVDDVFVVNIGDCVLSLS